MYSNLADSIDKSLYHLQMALELSDYASDTPHIMGNYIEALRINGNIEQAIHVCNTKALIRYKTSPVVLFNCAIIYHTQGQGQGIGSMLSKAVDIFRTVNRLNPYMQEAWLRVMDIAMKHPELVNETSFSLYQYVYDALRIHPNSYALLHIAGTLEHKLENYEKAIQLYIESDRIQPSNYHNLANIGAIYQALGDAEAAALIYENLIVYHSHQHDAGLYNNYGSLMGVMMHKEEELFWLSKAYKLNPRMNNVNINLGGFYQDEGHRNLSRHFLSQAVASSENRNLLQLRMMLYVSPIAQSWTQVLRERVSLQRELSDFCSVDNIDNVTKEVLDSSLDRIHFHLVYHGLFDRDLQQLIVQCYHKYIHNLDAVYINSTTTEAMDAGEKGLGILKSTEAKNSKDKMRIGFISKFFGVFEPHGQLLDGIMSHLPRDTFEVYAFPIPRTDLKPLSHSIARGVDKIVEIPLANSFAATIIAQCHLDVLVFADTMSEPVSHFLAHTRLAPIQVAFWGNPVTSASLSIDYFVSADHMEHPYRTMIPSEQEPYTEQVVLIEGQGIWYHTPKSAHEELMLTNWSTYVNNEAAQAQVATKVNRTSLNLDQDWFIFLCPQSVFKMHPSFDTVFTNILYRIPEAHILLTEGRRPTWTQTYIERIYDNMWAKITSMNIQEQEGQRLFAQWTSRLHITPRVSSEKFISLLEVANVVLHPFPFDGSKTSADAIWAGIPYITLPSEYLRGRMGMQYLRTMNIPALCATNMSHYVQIAVQLADPKQSLYTTVVAQMRQRKDLIFEDLEVPYQWSKFFTRLHPKFGVFTEKEGKEENSKDNRNQQSWLFNQSYVNFLRLHHKDVDKEIHLLQVRENNRALFDHNYGNEKWLLDNDGSAILQGTHDVYIPIDRRTRRRTTECNDSFITRNLRIFNNWEDCNGCNGNDYDNEDVSENKHASNNGNDDGVTAYETEPTSTCVDHGIDPVQVDDNGFAILPPLDTPPRAQRLLTAIRQHLAPNTSKVPSTIANSALQITLLQADYEDNMTNTGDITVAMDDNSVTSLDVMNRLDLERDVALRDEKFWYLSISTMRNSVLHSDVSSALHIVTHLLAFHESHADTPAYRHRYTALFFTEAGCVFYFNGLYEDALHHCQISVGMDKDATLAHMCVGVSGLYTKDKHQSLMAFQRAIWLRKQEERGDISSRNVMKSSIFTAPRDAIEYNWITALSSFHLYEECTMGLEQILQLPLVYKANDGYMLDGTGVLLFTMGFIDWSDHHWQHLSLAFQRNISMPVRLSPTITADRQVDATRNSDGDENSHIVSIHALSSKQDIIHQIATLQHQYQHLLTTGSYCLMYNEASKPMLFAAYFYLAHLLDTVIVTRMNEKKYALTALPLDVSMSETGSISLTSSMLPFYSDKAKAGSEARKNTDIHLLSQYFFPLSAPHVASQSPSSSNEREHAENHGARDIASALYLNVMNKYIDMIHLFVDTSNLHQMRHLTWYHESHHDNRDIPEMVKRHVLYYLDTDGNENKSNNNDESITEERCFSVLFQQKVVVSVRKDRLHFKQAFAYANAHIPTNSKVIIANSDIYFDGSLKRLCNNINNNNNNGHESDGYDEAVSLSGRLMALSKWVERYSKDSPEPNNDTDVCEGQLKERLHTLKVMFGSTYSSVSMMSTYRRDYLHLCHQQQIMRAEHVQNAVRLPNHISINIRVDSQDAWIFSLPLPDSIIEQSDFPLGVTRCDNRLAAIFTEQGYKVSNPSLLGIRAIERMTTYRETSLYTWDGAVFGEVKNVLLSLDF